MNCKAMRLNQITVPAVDVDASLSWYQHLGFRLLVDSPTYKRLIASEGGTTLSLSEVQTPTCEPSTHLYLECDSAMALDSKVTELKQTGIVFLSEPVDQDWLWREAWLRDPSGNLVCLYFAGNNRLHPPWQVVS
ncbi:MAG: VOC family protein [Robiginitomaculum sp.]|nr:VOC family protein [Robiginitomaculum sp.]